MNIKSFSYRVGLAYFFVLVNDKTQLVPSMVLSTAWVLFLATVMPWAMPLMVDAAARNAQP